MTIYEGADDYGLAPGPFGKFDSKEFGSAGPRIACCVIRPYFIDWFVYEELQADQSVRPNGKNSDR